MLLRLWGYWFSKQFCLGLMYRVWVCCVCVCLCLVCVCVWCVCVCVCVCVSESYIKLLPEELVVVSHSSVHLFL